MAGGTKEDDDRQTSSVENYSKTFCLESKQRNGVAAGKAGDVNTVWRVDGETDDEREKDKFMRKALEEVRRVTKGGDDPRAVGDGASGPQ